MSLFIDFLAAVGLTTLILLVIAFIGAVVKRVNEKLGIRGPRGRCMSRHRPDDSRVWFQCAKLDGHRSLTHRGPQEGKSGAGIHEEWR